jgi:hypothetical protein
MLFQHDFRALFEAIISFETRSGQKVIANVLPERGRSSRLFSAANREAGPIGALHSASVHLCYIFPLLATLNGHLRPPPDVVIPRD